MDLLVKLYALPPPTEEKGNAVVRRAFAAEKFLLVDFAAKHFSRGWASECEVTFARQPISCFIALAANAICGFACYDATARGFFGPIGVKEEQRKRGFGSALLLAALHDMYANGYAYAVIGATDNANFYRAVGAIEIPDSAPGFYSGMVHE